MKTPKCQGCADLRDKNISLRRELEVLLSVVSDHAGKCSPPSESLNQAMERALANLRNQELN